MLNIISQQHGTNQQIILGCFVKHGEHVNN
jgi:hypothetical protein